MRDGSADDLSGVAMYGRNQAITAGLVSVDRRALLVGLVVLMNIRHSRSGNAPTARKKLWHFKLARFRPVRSLQNDPFQKAQPFEPLDLHRDRSLLLAE